MPLIPQIQQFAEGSTPNPPIDNGMTVPNELDIFFRNENEFLPPGKTFKDLTEQEKKDLINKYRFDVYRPGQYQGITGIIGGNRMGIGDLE